MSLRERDPHTGHMTTGHEWNGIKELNTPVPKPVWFFLIATFTFSVIYWVLMPAWPYGVDFTRGLLGFDQRQVVEEQVAAAAAQRASWTDRIMDADLADIQADPVLMEMVRETGYTLFGDNCAVCHGFEGQGGPGYPAIGAAPWVWGGELDDILETIRVGINSSHPESRYAQMLAFGRDQMLSRADISLVVDYVQTLSQPELAAELDAGDLAVGAEIFAVNCAGCHGEDATGIEGTGAPDLTDEYWTFGGDRASIFTSVYDGRQGHMPHWEGRLGDVERRLLALYVLDLRDRQ